MVTRSTWISGPKCRTILLENSSHECVRISRMPHRMLNQQGTSCFVPELAPRHDDGACALFRSVHLLGALSRPAACDPKLFSPSKSLRSLIYVTPKSPTPPKPARAAYRGVQPCSCGTMHLRALVHSITPKVAVFERFQVRPISHARICHSPHRINTNDQP